MVCSQPLKVRVNDIIITITCLLILHSAAANIAFLSRYLPILH